MKNCLLVVIFSLINLINTSFAQFNWSLQTNPLGEGQEAMLGKVHFVSETEGWISCGSNGGFLHTTDAGLNWVYVNPFPNDTVGSTCDPAISMSWVSQTHGWKINTFGGIENAHGAVIYKTTNAGISWSKVELSNEETVFGVQVQFVNENVGWALTYSFSTGIGQLLHSTDGGNSWSSNNAIGIFYFIDQNNGYAFSGNGQNGSQPPYKIHKTTDGGLSWNDQFSDNSIGMYNTIFFSDINHGWIVGEEGKVLKTVDGGLNWNFITNSGINPQESTCGLFFIDENIGWISSKESNQGQTPFVQHTTDGGNTWSTQSIPLGDLNGGNRVFNIFFTNPQKGWLIADRGRIAVYSSISSIYSDGGLIKNFSLEQNYPNPFNPTTSIKYALKSRQFVSLKVYNVIGKEIAVLVNDEREAGIHTADFNAAELPAGVYFYTLNTNDFNQTKKMILLK
jgi:photosystem II stability/assembly factor-like uncharacterized protein